MGYPSKTIFGIRRKPKGKWYTHPIFFIFCLLIISFALFFFLNSKNTKGGAEVRNGNWNPNDIKQISDAIKKAEANIQSEIANIFSLQAKYKNKTGEDLPLGNMLNLPEAEKKIFEQKIREEQDFSIKGLLSDILNKREEILKLKATVEQLENQLPKPHVVEKGENHYQIAINYLLDLKSVTKDDAKKLIARVSTSNPLMPGFKVWLYYDGVDFVTSVTQGYASISPDDLIKLEKGELIRARDNALEECNRLRDEIDNLNSKKREIILSLESLKREHAKLMAINMNLVKANETLQAKNNSLFYKVDTEKNLIDLGILKSRFLGSTKQVKFDKKYFKDSIDLSSTNSIQITATDLSLQKIKRVKVYSKFKEGLDYKINITPDKQHAEVKIENTGNMTREDLVISVE